MKAKRFFSVLLVVMMLVSCFAISASAATEIVTGGPIKDTTAPVTLKINLTVGTDSQEVAGTEGKTEGTVQTPSGAAIAGAKFEIWNEAGTAKVIDEAIYTDANGVAIVTNNTGTNDSDEPFYTTSAGDKKTVLVTNALVQGRYTVKNTGLGTNQFNLVSDFKVDLPMTNVADNGYLYVVNVYPKVPIDTDKPSIDKEVSDNAATGFAHSKNIDTYNNGNNNGVEYWKITVTLPQNIETYKSFLITDVLDTKLKNPANLTLTYNGTNTLTAGSDKDYTAAFVDTDATVTGGKKLVVNFNAAGIAKLEATKQIVITYSTVIDLDNASAIGTRIGNHVILNYTNKNDVDGKVDNTPDDTTDDGFDPTDPTPPEDKDFPNNPDDNTDGKKDSDPYVYTGKLTVTKVDTTNTAIAIAAEADRAEFSLYTADPTNKNAEQLAAILVKTTKVDANGVFEITGLKAQKYYLLETKAPKGYELNGTVTEIEIGKDGKFDATKTDGNLIQTKNIVNKPSTNLPLTGGMGVGIFAMLGLALVAFGGVSVYKTRKSN